MRKLAARWIGLVVLASTSGCPLPRLYVLEAGADVVAADVDATASDDTGRDAARSDDTMDASPLDAPPADGGDGGPADVLHADAFCGNDACDPGESPCGCPSDCAPSGPRVLTPTFVGSWQNYGSPYAPLRCAVDSAGLAHLSGVVQYAPDAGSALTTMSAIALLPLGCVPRGPAVEFAAVMGTITGVGSTLNTSGVGAIVASTDHQLYWLSPPTSGASLASPSFTSLDGIVYIGDTSGLPEPTPIMAWSGSWASAPPSLNSGPAGYYVDPAGEVHLTGSVTRDGGAPSSGVTEPMFNLPTAVLPSNRVVFDAIATTASHSQPATARIDVVHGSPTVKWYSGPSGSNLRVSLDGIAFRGPPYTVIWAPATITTPWSDYIATSSDDVYLGSRTDCLGVVHGRGRVTYTEAPAVASGGGATPITTLAVHPAGGRRIFPALSGAPDVGGRLDVDTTGGIFWMAGQNMTDGYTSFANITYLP